MKRSMRILTAAVLLALAPLAAAQTTGTIDTQVSTLDKTAATRGQALVAGKIASNFTNLAGSEENALNLVNGLRNGTTITLTTTTTTTPPPPDGTGTGGTTGTGGSTGTGGATGTGGTGGTTGTTGGTTTTTTSTIDPATGKMGWGNVKIALALAQDSLARAGITNPTPEQLAAALNGGDITVTNADGTTTTLTLKGVLAMRASGMGWGQIAQANGTKVGPVVSQLRMANTKVAALPKATSGTSTTTVSGGSVKSKGLVTASGTTTGGNKSSKGITTAEGGSATHGKSSKGITTASGGSVSHGQSSKGITTASGGAAGASSHGITTAQGGATSGSGHGNSAFGRGMVTAAGGSVSTTAVTAGGSGHGAGAGLVSGAGSSQAGGGVTTAQGNGGGNGNGHGRGKGGG